MKGQPIGLHITRVVTERRRGEICRTLNFQLFRQNRIYFAICTVCKKPLKNIATTRLRKHREKCTMQQILRSKARQIAIAPLLANLKTHEETQTDDPYWKPQEEIKTDESFDSVEVNQENEHGGPGSDAVQVNRRLTVGKSSRHSYDAIQISRTGRQSHGAFKRQSEDGHRPGRPHQDALQITKPEECRQLRVRVIDIERMQPPSANTTQTDKQININVSNGDLSIQSKKRRMVESQQETSKKFCEMDINTNKSVIKDSTENIVHNSETFPTKNSAEKAEDSSETKNAEYSTCNSSNLPIFFPNRSTYDEDNESTTSKSDCVIVEENNGNDEIDDAFADFMYACNLPFNVVESVYFKKFVAKLNRNYAKKIPSKRKLSGELLISSYRRCIKNSSESIGNDSVLVINSCSDLKRTVCFLSGSSGNKAYLDFVDVSKSDKLLDTVLSAIDIAKNVYKTNVYAIVSDDNSFMNKMVNDVNWHLWHSTCNIHIANSLAEEILDETLTENVISIMKEFQDSVLASYLKKVGGSEIKLPTARNCWSHKTTYENLSNNINAMKTVITTADVKISPPIIQLIFNKKFIEDVEKCIDLLNLIYILIQLFQKPNIYIADSANIWLNSALNGCSKTKFESIYKQKLSMALNEYAVLAYYFHPYYDKSILDEMCLSRINSLVLKHLDGPALKEWTHWRVKSGIFKILFEKNLNGDAFLFWNLAAVEYPTLSNFVLRLLQIPASSYMCKLEHTPKLVNCLEIESSKKLMYVYTSLNLQETTEHSNNKHFPDSR